ncbi:MAG: SDR family oxidoreductase [Betaproteobacteria bacterium]|nr:SDR family oxidoreductase [Betaproteobacteria bacterium]
MTGASDGIGAALARRYAARGWRLGLVARREAALAEVAESCAVPCSTYAVDVRDGPALAAAAADFLERTGPPDVVIANAGVSAGTITEFPEDIATWRWILDVNVIGMVQTLQPFVGPMRQAGRGTIVGIASVAGFRGLPGAGAYCASKAAAITYLESLRVELAGSGVHVVTICPGYVATRMTAANPYPMPFRIDADTAAERMVRAIDRRKSFVVIPRRMAVAATLLRALPRPVFDRVFRNAGRKPRVVRDAVPSPLSGDDTGQP